MKKIVLIGDSIRMGYDAYVREQLQGKAEVLYPAENCRFAQYVYRYLHDWKQEGNWGDDVDLVHWNAGLWDVIHMMDEDALSTPAQYEATVGQIARRIRLLFPRAIGVFATSTPVQEEKYGREFWRKNEEIERYNEIAKRTVTACGGVIDDLYAVMKEAPDSERSDMTHFYTPEGTKRIGEAVLGCICPLLGIER